MRVAIFGAGGAGGYFGAHLAKAGNDVAFIARGSHLRAIRESGLVVETPQGIIEIAPARATDSPAELGHVDLVLVGVKAWQVLEAARAMLPLIGKETSVIPLQNGVEARHQLATVLGQTPVLMGLCGTFSWVTRPGHIRNIGVSNFIRFGESDSKHSSRTERLLRAFVEAGIDAGIPQNIHHALWMKFLAVTAFGGIGALSRAPIGVLRSLPQTRRLLELCATEAFHLSSAMGVGLTESSIADTLSFFDKLAPDGTTSLQRDIADGKPSELDYWNGAVVRLAHGKDVAVPTHRLIYDLLTPLENRARGTLVFQ